MRIAPFYLRTLLTLILASPLLRADLTLQSGPGRVHLLELYTSEGCSSCPPAERWLSALRTNPRLWKDIVPVAFHVDYWDNLGWKDTLARSAFTARQRRYAATWGTDTVYTPGLVLDGREWTTRDLATLPASPENAGSLNATLDTSGLLTVTFQPGEKQKGEWQINAAVLGFGLSSEVKAGENRGRQLQHDFVALAIETAPLRQTATVATTATAAAQATLHLPAAGARPGQSALVIWVTETGKPEPLQAAGAPF